MAKVWLCVGLLLLAAAPLLAQDETIIQPLEAPPPADDTRPLNLQFPPQFVLVQVSEEHAEQRDVAVSFKVPFARTLGDGADGRSAWANLQMTIDGKTARAYDSDGKPIEPKHLPMRLAKPTRALLFYGDIDPYYLGLYRKEVVLFVIPEKQFLAP